MDQCTHCTLKGDIKTCCETPCYQHESWMVGELRKALNDMVEMYIGMVNSGDCGNWNPEEDEEVVAARKVLTLGKL